MLKELTCRELVELVTDYFEGVLPPGERRRFDEHLADCWACTIYLEQLETTTRLTGSLREDDVSPIAAAVLLAAFGGWRDRNAGIPWESLTP